MLSNWLVVLLLATFSLINGSKSAISPEVEQLIYSWAPLIFLHSEEAFYPSSVEFFLPEITINDDSGTILQEVVTPDNILGGENTSSLHMQTREPLDCPTCTNLEVLYGVKAVSSGRVPVYAIYREHGDPLNTLDVIYHTFYPYNLGKEECVGIPVNDDTCLGQETIFGNHVGDWEHNTLRFQNGKPIEMYVSVHSFGAYYAWNETNNNFQYTQGEPILKSAVKNDERDAKYTPNYPPTVEMFAGTIPMLYSANGSHGLWSAPGDHDYVPIPGYGLTDYTDAGVAWFTRDNLVMIEWQSQPSNYGGDLSWINFRGDWGNEKDGCYPVLLGNCELGGGPSGPPKDGDFQPPE